MNRQDLTATSWVTTRLAAFVLGAVGVYFIATARSTSDSLSQWLGGKDAALGVGLGAGFLLLAVLTREKNALRVRVAELMEGLNQLLYGKDYSRDRQAIELLVRALEGTDANARDTAHRHLVRLTGLQFAPDPFVWRAWWSANEKTWTAKAAAHGGREDAPPPPPPPPAATRP